jgi:class 3 adenylate cyclase
MTDVQSIDLTIMLADVADSVRYYEEWGDQQAHDNIVMCLKIMAQIIESNNGRVIEIVGDEIMSTFDSPDAAFGVACKIQKRLSSNSQLNLGVRIGIHAGMTGVEKGHPFGDTVNVAARMVGLAKTGQVILSEQVYVRLSEGNKSRSLYFNDVFIKGKSKPYIIYQMVWDQLEMTILRPLASNGKQKNRRRQIKSICLVYKQTQQWVSAGKSELLVGRGKQCGLLVDTSTASRVHATIGFDGKKFALFDRSTNGTYIKNLIVRQNALDTELYIHHKELEIRCDGMISLGEPVYEENPDLISLVCIY